MSKKANTAPKTTEKAPEKEAETAVNPANTAPKTAAKSDKVPVSFLRSHPRFGYFAGDKAEISQADYEELVKTGPFVEQAEK